MNNASPAAALARSLHDKLGTADLAVAEVALAVDSILREIGLQYGTRVAELEAEIARRDAVDHYRQALAQAGVILHDRPDLLPNSDLAADMILRGVSLRDVRVLMLEAGRLH